MLAAVKKIFKKGRFGVLFLFYNEEKIYKNKLMRKNVIDLLNNELDDLIDAYGEVHLGQAFYTPSFIVPLVCYLNRFPINQNGFGVHPKNKSYFETIGLYKQLWGHHDLLQRINCGVTYSPIVRLDSSEHVDRATADICGCIRLMVGYSKSKGLSKLEAVVGELHDNVWSHGKSTGFSMAQKYQDFIEFTLADQGFGLLGEMKRVGKQIFNHEDAIGWCIQEGNSTKHADDEDPWLQRLPNDLIGDNPMGEFGGEVNENHHQGLGLFHLINLVESFNGELYLISGDQALHIKNRKRTYLPLNHEWSGVIISCRFDRNELLSSDYEKTVDDEKVSNIIKRLRGDQNEYITEV